MRHTARLLLAHCDTPLLDEPNELLLRPASRRVAELVGYLGFVPSDGKIAGIHPNG